MNEVLVDERSATDHCRHPEIWWSARYFFLYWIIVDQYSSSP